MSEEMEGGREGERGGESVVCLCVRERWERGGLGMWYTEAGDSTCWEVCFLEDEPKKSLS